MVASVCKRWRFLALSYPRLWSRIEHLHGAGPDILDNTSSLDLQLQRCGSAPLSALLHCGGTHWTDVVCGAALAFTCANASKLGFLKMIGRISQFSGRPPTRSSPRLGPSQRA
ncbi:hypothetical protein BDV98DRAFT_418565 [Pterulicium gracile]|uniref:F-box domain-containing protein n=1 Tax=Pterulicium gracile TaxID=1884261 RepID=A0A5C3QRM9_9AGAR|nr:hypothetical protein BDV98DRAFT_418565 [Pterula gracilis]